MEKEEGKIIENKRFSLYKNTVEINPDFEGNIPFVVRKDDILGYCYEDCPILLYDHHKSKGYTDLSIDEWAKEGDFNKEEKLYYINVFFSERVVDFVDQFLEEKGAVRGEYVFYYFEHDVDDGLFMKDVQDLEEL